MLNAQLVDAINLWKTYYLKKGSSFWIHHKNGNMGRPYDAQYTLEQICIKDDLVEITYDTYRKVLIQNPSKIELSKDKAGNIRLSFSGFAFVEAVLVDYGIDAPQADDFRHIKTQSADDELRLVGHSPNISDPLSEADADYQVLYMKAKLSQNW
jgi:hypothetical protein